MGEARLMLVVSWLDGAAVTRDMVESLVDEALGDYFGNTAACRDVSWEWAGLPTDLTPERAEELGLIK